MFSAAPRPVCNVRWEFQLKPGKETQEVPALRHTAARTFAFEFHGVRA